MRRSMGDRWLNRRMGMVLAVPIAWVSLSGAQLPAAPTLDIYVIDVEGGEATLFVGPSGESLLMDTGWPGFDGREVRPVRARRHPLRTADRNPSVPA